MEPYRVRSLVFLASVLALAASAALAEDAILVTVDATRTQQKLLHTHLVMPVKSGPLTLYYPKWIPGEHGPDGPIANLTGLKFEADGQTVPWQRDLLDVFAFHLEIPHGISHLDVDFDYIEPDGVSATDKLLVLEWNEVVLYPADIPAEKLTYEAKLLMPDAWKFGTALPVESAARNQVLFKPISLDLLVDSPVITGEFYRSIDLTPPGEPIHHEIDIAADSADALNMSPENQKEMTNLVAESSKLFGARTIATIIFCSRSAIMWHISASSTTSRTTAACRSELSFCLVPACRWADCWRTNLSTPGMASFADPRI